MRKFAYPVRISKKVIKKCSASHFCTVPISQLYKLFWGEHQPFAATRSRGAEFFSAKEITDPVVPMGRARGSAWQLRHAPRRWTWRRCDGGFFGRGRA